MNLVTGLNKLHKSIESLIVQKQGLTLLIPEYCIPKTVQNRKSVQGVSLTLTNIRIFKTLNNEINTPLRSKLLLILIAVFAEVRNNSEAELLDSNILGIITNKV